MISLCEDRRFKDTENLKCEDGKFQNFLLHCVFETEVILANGQED